ncbi:class I SAM-dependent methyltransferase [Candidatus Woesearchaeota archaeon]|nr:class I SAM-dependent methyltransferase [Candidatus Woesearchaeota archaeon]
MQDILNYFAKLDTEKKEKGTYVHDTTKGIFGVSDTTTLLEFFKKIKLEEAEHVVDLGSGDGRVAIIASFFTRASGVEFDPALIAESKTHAKKLNSTARFFQRDFEEFDFHDVDVLFSYADQPFSDTFLKKLHNEFTGTLYVYQGIFLPEANKAKKGKTEWVAQTPFISYTFGKK